MKTFVSFLLALLCLIAESAFGTIRRVPLQYATIQSAINACSNGDTVLVSDSTYYENINFMGKAIIVASTFLTTGDTSHISRTIIDGSRPTDSLAASVVTFSSGEDTTSILYGFTITGGRGTAGISGYRAGGGILCYYSGARISHNTITRNSLWDPSSAINGGGISCFYGYSVIEENRIDSNSLNGSQYTQGGGIGLNYCGARIMHNVIAANSLVSTHGEIAGGGILCVTSPGNHVALDVIGNTIAYNVSEVTQATTYACTGGGIFAGTFPNITTDPSVTLRLIGNDIIGNMQRNTYRCSGTGGVLVACSDSSVIDGNKIIGNVAIGGSDSRGGGLNITVWIPSIISNNIVAQNSTQIGGGFRFYQNYSLRRCLFVNNTVAFNTALSDGAGIYSSGADMLIMNSIVYGDTGTEISQYGGNFRVVYSNIQYGWADSGNIDVDPMFDGSTYRLANTSGCKEKGVDSIQIDGVWHHAPPFCIYGMARPTPAWRKPDIGACENPVPVVSVDEFQSGVPSSFALHQNYPNPFNPSTTISYQLPRQSYVTLKVYDVLGREVAALVDEAKQPGTYAVQWNASRMASGVYYYRMQAGSFVQLRKMLLLK